MARRRRSSKGGGALAMVLVAGLLIGMSIYLHRTYGTLEPCGMLRAETQVRLMDGRIDTLGDVPKLIVNNGDQLWCAKEFSLTQFR